MVRHVEKVLIFADRYAAVRKVQNSAKALLKEKNFAQLTLMSRAKVHQQ
jgi:hypothetical protein